VPSEVSEREQKVLNIIETARNKRQKFRDVQITMAHGAGGKATQGLIEGLLVPAFANETLEAMADAGTVAVLGGNVAMTTDSFVVNPISFPGGTIGELAVNGTVNDLAMAGAKPLALTSSSAGPAIRCTSARRASASSTTARAWRRPR
jgi:hydrogenase expression/formation protein HypE